MPKVKVNINSLKKNFASVIITINGIPDAKFKADSPSSFGDLTSQKVFLGRRERVIRLGYLPPENGFNFKKISFYFQNRSSQPKIDPLPMSILAIFKQRKIFSFLKFWGRLDEKRVAATSLTDQFC